MTPRRNRLTDTDTDTTKVSPPRWLSSVAVIVVSLGVFAVALGSVLTSCGDEPEPRTIEFVIPAGTAERMAAGETVVVMPSRLEFKVGEKIRIRNEDSVKQSVGPYVVAAESEMLLQYGKEGTYEGYCPLSEGESYEIVVTAS